MTQCHLCLLRQILKSESPDLILYPSRRRGYLDLQNMGLIAWDQITLNDGHSILAGWKLTPAGRREVS